MKVKFVKSKDGLSGKYLTIGKVYQVIEVVSDDVFKVFNDGGYDWHLFKEEVEIIEEVHTDQHYNNTNGSLYKFAQDHELNAWEFDIIKRITRCRKKGQFKEDLEKTKRVIDLYLKEFEL